MFTGYHLKNKIMKYLKLHKVLWFLIVLIFTTIELIYFLFIEVVYFIWNLKFFKYECFFSDDRIYRGNCYVDKNPIDTFKRHYTFFN